MVATSFWNAFTANLAADFKDYVVDAMKVGLIIYLEFPEGCGKREERDIQNAEKRLQWFDDVFKPLCSLSLSLSTKSSSICTETCYLSCGM